MHIQVGADGAQSRVRQYLGMSSHGFDYNQRYASSLLPTICLMKGDDAIFISFSWIRILAAKLTAVLWPLFARRHLTLLHFSVSCPRAQWPSCQYARALFMPLCALNTLVDFNRLLVILFCLVEPSPVV
jgi:hypothetical protein